MKRKFDDDCVAMNTRSKKPRLVAAISNNFNKRNIPWISATKTYNYMVKDSIVDWFKLCGKKERSFSNDFEYTHESFSNFLMKKGVEFEKEIIKFLNSKHKVITVSEYYNVDKVEETIRHMKDGIPIIHSAPIYNKRNNTFGIIDLLVRSDYFEEMFNISPITNDEKSIPAPKLQTPFHYRVVDIKYSSLHLSANGTNILNQGKIPAYKAQLCIYNDALTNIQGYDSQKAYLLGRRCNYTSKGDSFFNNSCLDRLGVIDFNDFDKSYVDTTKDAIKWYRNVLKYGIKWDVLNPTNLNMYPNMCVDSGIWNNKKEKLANELGDITMLWQCGVKHRQKAFEHGVKSWRDTRCNSEVLGLGKKYGRIVDNIIKINRDSHELISPKKIDNHDFDWSTFSENDLFVDFETFNDVCKPLTTIPIQDRFEIIYMIGVGYVKDNKWVYKSFTCKSPSYEEEYNVIDDFMKFVNSYSKNPRIIYWHAEKSFWKRAVEKQLSVNSENRRNILSNWKLDDWFDLCQFFRENSIVIKGCFGFGLKPISQKMREYGMINTYMESECKNGMMAMVKAWRCYNTSSDPVNAPIMRDIMKYNEFDCKVLWDILTYLRKNHS
tara:strand:+ start:551 stop:2365 length:1815 start_codon:yes stop_codon:yes gene_type:complete